MTIDTTTTTLDQFIADHAITMHAERTDHNPHMADPRSMDHWRVRENTSVIRLPLQRSVKDSAIAAQSQN